jgi:hypothetical protein
VGKDVDFANPKNIIIGALALVAAGSAGSMLGITIEPAETTELRVAKAQLEAKVTSLQEKLETQKINSDGRVALLESIVDDCRRLIAVSRERLEEER